MKTRLPLIFAITAVILAAAGAQAAALSDVCRDVCFSREEDGLYDCQTEIKETCSAQMFQGMEFIISNARARFTPPLVTEGRAEYGAGAVRFFAKMREQKKRKSEDDETQGDVKRTEVVALYSLDGRKTWRDAPLGRDPVTGEWTGTADIGETGADTLHYFFRAVDVDGNAYIEIPCETTSFPSQPGDCMVPLATDMSYSRDYEDFRVDPWLDILGSRVGADAKDLRFEIDVEADINPGKSIPKKINYIFVAVMNPDTWTRREPYQNTSVLIYAPLKFTRGGAAMFRRFGSEWDYDESIVKQRVAGSRVHLLAPLDWAVGKNKSGWFTVVLGSGTVIGENSSVVKDYTMMTAVRPVERTLKLER